MAQNKDSLITRSCKSKICILLACILISVYNQCVHDEFARNTPKYFYNDFNEMNQRLLQNSSNVGKLRIFVDYSQVTFGNFSIINYVKRVTNISATYFYNVLKVDRLERVYYPGNVSRVCNSLTIPQQYVKEGVIGDIGVVCGNQQSNAVKYVAKSVSCSFLQSTRRPNWGMIQWNNQNLRPDQQGFQEMVFVGIHEFTHLLGFSALMYEIYPTGNPLIEEESGDKFLSKARINQQVQAQYGCSNGKGMLLEDQDGTLIGSHWERKVAGNQYMISSNKKGSFVSRITLALLQSTGWYPEVNYDLAQKSTWGKDKGCSFLNIDDCDSEQFCSDTSFYCDWEGTAIGRCNNDIFAGACKIPRYFTNTVCVDQSYELKNLNAALKAMERGGYYSKCFNSNFRQTGLTPNILNNRCYISVCSVSGSFIYILVGSSILICRAPGAEISAPIGLEGTLNCPDNFANYCENKQSCAFHCNNNGACINGMCLCTGNTFLTPTCLDVDQTVAPVGTTGGLQQRRVLGAPTTIKRYKFNSKCFSGYIFDSKWGQCLLCSDVFGCSNCSEEGCTVCDNRTAPVDGRC